MKRALWIALVACHHAPAPVSISSEAPADARPYATPTRACVEAFVARDLGTRGELEVYPVPSKDAPKYLLFTATWGEAHDCEAGCFSSSASGVALSCDRIGWFDVNDYERGHHDHVAFAITPSDAALFDERVWPTTFLQRELVAWIAKSPGTPADVQAKARAYLQRLP